MIDDSLLSLINGYKSFYQNYKGEEYQKYREEAAIKQNPRVMVISCSDSRVSPYIVTNSPLGEIFKVCNVANIVPPYRPDGTHHSTSSALEFAVGSLAVEHIIVMGHSGCGGIRSLLDGVPVTLDGECSFIASWIEIIAEAKEKVVHLPKNEKYLACELEALKISLGNLLTFPWIAERIKNGKLSINAWHFDIASGVIISYDKEKDEFLPIV
ncbi:MAG: carbonic anhydrase [Pseudomonadota bacterium]